MASLNFSKTAFILIALFLLQICFQNHIASEALVLEEEFSGKVVTDMKVNLPADELWAVFRSPDYLKLLASLAPDFYNTVTYVRGTGGVGTVVNITIQPAVGGGYWYDQITKLDDKTRTRTLTHRQGNFRNAGFTFFESEYIIIMSTKSSSVVRMTFSFDVEQASLSNISQALTTWGPAITIADYVNSVRKTPVILKQEFSGEIVTDMKVNLPAIGIWDVYRSEDFGYLLASLMPGYFKQVIYEDGTGQVGTVFNATLQPAFGSLNWAERIITIDDIAKTRIVRRIRGAFMEAGFTAMDAGYTIIEKPKKSSVIRSFTPFSIKAESLSNASLSPPDWTAAITVANYVNSMKLDQAE